MMTPGLQAAIDRALPTCSGDECRELMLEKYSDAVKVATSLSQALGRLVDMQGWHLQRNGFEMPAQNCRDSELATLVDVQLLLEIVREHILSRNFPCQQHDDLKNPP